MSKTIELPKEKWEDLCNKIENEGLGYYLMYYESPEGFKEAVNGDKEAIRLFKEAESALRAFKDYLRLSEFEEL